MAASTTEIISGFENEQKSTVFSALSEYLSTGLFVDISLVCKGQILRAHKVVLSSSSKYFKDLFRHQPGVTLVDLDKELAPNDLNLTLEDVQLIIGILYCVGTVEISPQRIETLLVCSQVLGIPTLISFLKQIRESINEKTFVKDCPSILEYHDIPNLSDPKDVMSPGRSYNTSSDSSNLPSAQPNPRTSGEMMYIISPSSQHFPPAVYPTLPSTSAAPTSGQKTRTTGSGFTPGPAFPLLDLSLVKPMTESCVNTPEPTPTKQSRQPSLSPVPGPSGVKDSMLYQKKTSARQLGSRISSSSFSGFSLHSLQSPRLKSTETSVSDNPSGSRLGTSVLDVLDQNLLMHLNNLQANQLDDLENVLLPHLTVDPRTQDSPGQNLLDIQNMELSASGASSVGSYETIAEENLEPVEENETPVVEEFEETVETTKQVEDNPDSVMEPPDQLTESSDIAPSLIASEPPVLKKISDLTVMTNSEGSLLLNLHGHQPRNKDANILKPLGDKIMNKALSSEPCKRRMSSAVTRSLHEKNIVGFRCSSVPLLARSSPPLMLTPALRGKVSKLTGTNLVNSPDNPELNSNLLVPNSVRWTPVKGITLSPLKNLLRHDTVGDLIMEKDTTNKLIQDDNDVRDDDIDDITTEEGISQDQDDEAQDQHPREIIMNLDQVCQTGQKMKFSIPGVSREVTLNFSAEALQEMKNAALRSSLDLSTEGDQNSEISSTKQVSLSDSEEKSPIPQKKPKRMKKNLRQKLKSNLSSRPLSTNTKVRDEITCSVCLKPFSNEAQLKKHMKFHVKKNIICKFCSESFEKAWVYNKHLEEEHQIKEKHECPDCSRMFYQRTELLAHIQSFHQTKKVFKCQVCHLDFNHKHLLVKHLTSWHSTLPISMCNLCTEIFEDVNALDSHICPGAEITNRNIICHQHEVPVKLTSRQELQVHMSKEHNDGAAKFQIFCCICQKSFLLRNNLNKHLRNIHKLETGGNISRKEFKCTVCDKVFYYKNDLRNHMEIHSASKKYNCSSCNKSFYCLKSQKQHERYCSSDQTWSCEICNKQLSSKFKLRAHKLTHSQDRSFSCQVCNQMFKEKRTMIKHLKNKHKETTNKPFQISNETEEQTTEFPISQTTEMSMSQTYGLSQTAGMPLSQTVPLSQASVVPLSQNVGVALSLNEGVPTS